MIGPADVTVDVIRKTFESNVFGTVRVLHAFLPPLQRSGNPVVVNVSSGLGSLTQVAAAQYRSTRMWLPGLEGGCQHDHRAVREGIPNMRINAVDPGFTKTDLNGNTGIQTVEQGAEIIVRMAQFGSDGPTGGYFDANGAVPW